MKEQSEKLFRAIGDVGDDLIARADAPVKKAPRVWVKWAALAACCALVIGAAAFVVQMGGLLQISDSIVSQYGKKALPQRIEAIDVMLELSAAQPEAFYAVDQHILLRFSLGEPNFKQFVIVSGSDPPPEHEIQQDKKIIALLPDSIRPEAFSYTRHVIFAIRQENGTHRFFARK